MLDTPINDGEFLVLKINFETKLHHTKKIWFSRKC